MDAGEGMAGGSDDEMETWLGEGGFSAAHRFDRFHAPPNSNTDYDY